MNNKKIVYGAIAITFIVAVLALFTSLGKHSVAPGAVANVTTNLPSMGLAQLVVGNGCDQSYTSCVPALTVATTSITTGGLVLSTTTNGNATLGASDLLNFGSIVSTSTFTNAALTLTLPASSTLSAMVPVAGQSRTIHFVNATTSATVIITLAGNTGTILQSATSSKAIRNGGSADLIFYRPGTTTDAIGDIYVDLTNSAF